VQILINNLQKTTDFDVYTLQKLGVKKILYCYSARMH